MSRHLLSLEGFRHFLETPLELVLLTNLALQLHRTEPGVHDLVHHRARALIHLAGFDVFGELLQLLLEVAYLPAGLASAATRSRSPALLRVGVVVPPTKGLRRLNGGRAWLSVALIPEASRH
jgi:hypothetical protein